MSIALSCSIHSATNAADEKENRMTVKIKDVYVITDRGEHEKSSWSKIGIAFVNKDDSLNVILDAIPVSGKIHIRDRIIKNQIQNERKLA